MRTFGLRSWHAAEHAAVVRAAGAGKLTPSLRGAEISNSEHRLAIEAGCCRQGRGETCNHKITFCQVIL